jgi:hypothetical protein
MCLSARFVSATNGLRKMVLGDFLIRVSQVRYLFYVKLRLKFVDFLNAPYLKDVSIFNEMKWKKCVPARNGNVA